MTLPQIKIYDDQFAHAFTMANGGLNIKAKNFEWTRSNIQTPLAVVTESWFNRIHLIPEPIKIALILEPRGYSPYAYNWVRHNYMAFFMVLTHDASMLNIDPRFKFFPYGGSWIYEKDYGIYEKTKNISIIASGKHELPGHILRHEVVSSIKGVDIFGRDSNKLDYLLDGYKDYRFTICIENQRYDNWFTEKITNPLLCGCVPIYWGCPSISKFFKDIITFNNCQHLKEILSNFNYQEEYDIRKSSIQSNLEEAKKYSIAEDWIWENVLTEAFIGL